MFVEIFYFVAVLHVNFFFQSFSFDRVELVWGITKTVLLVTDIGTKLNGLADQLHATALIERK